MPFASTPAGSQIQNQAAHNEKPKFAWLWFAIVPLAALFRFLYLSRKSVYLDEALSVAYAHMNWHDFLQVLLTRDANMALYYLLLRGIVPIGDSEFWIRLLSVIAGVATIPVIYALGSELYDRRTGLLCALLLCVNACHVVYSQEARGYALALLLIALSSWLFIKAVESPSWGIWCAYGIVSSLAVHSHFYAGLVLVAQWLSLSMLPRRMVPLKHLSGAIILLAALISPALLFVLWHHSGHINWLPPFSWLEVYHTAIFLTADGGKLAGNLLLALCLIALAGATTTSLRKPAGSPLQRWKELFSWFWLLAPPLITAVGSMWTPMFFHRFLIVCLPAFVLLVARGLTSLPPNPAWVAVFVALSIVTVFSSYSRTRENWRDAVHLVLSQTQPGDAMWFYRGYSDTPFFYYESRSPTENRPERVADADAITLSGKNRLWAIFYPVGPPDVVAKESELSERYPVLEQSRFRGVRIALFNVNGSH
jgi:mannosyltransferase